MKERQSLRKFTDSLLRIQIEPDNDAMILNLSDGGLSFRALKPVAHSGTVHFSYLDNGRRIYALGQLVWTDSAGLTGGLSFASVPPMDREQLRSWAERSSFKEAELPRTEAPPSNAAPRSDVPGALPNFSPLESAIPGFALPVGEPPPSRFSWDRESHYPQYPRQGSRFFPGFVTGVIVTAVALAVLFFFYGNSADALRDQVRQSAGLSPIPQVVPTTIPVPPEPPPAATSPQSASVSPAPPGTSVPSSSAPLPSASDNSAGIAAPPTAAEPLQAQPPQPQTDKQKAGAPNNSPPKAAPAGEDDFSLAQRYLTAMPGPEGRAKATQYLWSAVEKGNVKAEITLADLYARGDGVSKNCAQARVLLRAAAEKGNAEASSKLAFLIRTGCS